MQWKRKGPQSRMMLRSHTEGNLVAIKSIQSDQRVKNASPRRCSEHAQHGGKDTTNADSRVRGDVEVTGVALLGRGR